MEFVQQAFAYHLITNLLILSCSVSEFPGLGFLPQSSNKLFDGFVCQLTCFTKTKPFIRNIPLAVWNIYSRSPLLSDSYLILLLRSTWNKYLAHLIRKCAAIKPSSDRHFWLLFSSQTILNLEAIFPSVRKYQQFLNGFTALFTDMRTLKFSLCRKRFQSSYCAKVRAEAKKGFFVAVVGALRDIQKTAARETTLVPPF